MLTLTLSHWHSWIEIGRALIGQLICSCLGVRTSRRPSILLDGEWPVKGSRCARHHHLYRSPS